MTATRQDFVCGSIRPQTQVDLEFLKIGGRDNSELIDRGLRLLSLVERAQEAGFTEVWVRIPGGKAERVWVL